MKANKRAARFGEPYAVSRPSRFVYIDIAPWSRHGCEVFTEAEMRRNADRRRKGRAIRKERRQILAALRMMPEIVDTVRRALDNLMRWVRQCADLVRSGEPVDLSVVA